MERYCRSPKEERNAADAVPQEEVWEGEALMAQVVEGAQLQTGSKAQHQKKNKSVALVVSVEKHSSSLDEWIVDSGCTNHMTGELNHFTNPTDYEGSKVVVIAEDSRYKIAHVGEVTLPADSNNHEVTLKNVFHVPGMGKNLFSVPQVTSFGKYVLFGPESIQIFDEFETKSKPIISGCRRDLVYVLSAETTYVDRIRGSPNADMWHSRLGHVSYDNLGLMMNKKLVVGLTQLSIPKGFVCSGCQFGKTHLHNFHHSSFKTKEPLEVVHYDVFGPMKCTSIRGMKYLITFIDDFSRFLWVGFMKEKSEALTKFKDFKLEAEKLTGKSVRVLRSDNGGEYLSQEFTKFMNECKIRRQLTCANTPQ